ncbi:urease accessory protein UreD [Thalassococcus sp. CAU 1522]|uniref:Urease accessory protein UreD n=2 Tax=Thalassococcus arenae TaxID=2851652 RepID=A0ABS6NDM4_9RHOB|nr:urease accessory protein UreD [Thalassococcus arenae]MBV2361704.1 urease accessory protein UreD [Thalassococcus arenae]
MSGSAKLLFPRNADESLAAVFLNTAGGVTGGDAFHLTASAEAGASLTLTTQAAERVYRALPDETGLVRTRLSCAEGATLHWLPQETILFDGAALDRHLSIDMAGDASLLACEVLVFGRAAMGEDVRDLRLRDRIDLRRDGRLCFADRLQLTGDAATALRRPFVADGARAMGSVVFAAPGAAHRLEGLRAGLPPQAGVSALHDDLVFLRATAADGFALRGLLIPLLARLSGAELPRPWMI